MRKTFLLLLLLFTMVNYSMGQKPTRDNIINAMKAVWEHPANTMQPKTTIDINDIKIGGTTVPTESQQLDGIPKGTIITLTKIDFVENTYFTGNTKKVRRITTGLMFRDKTGEWVVRNTGTYYPKN